MCHFITVILAGTFELDEVNRLGKQFSIFLEPTENRSVEKRLNQGESYFLFSNGVCACGTDLCGSVSAEESLEDLEDRKKKLLEAGQKKMGWSKAKIERWYREKLESLERFYRKHVHHDADCESWSEFIEKLFNNTGIVKVGLLLHMYQGLIESERIDVKERVVYRRDRLSPETLFTMEEDCLNIFTKN